MNYINRKQLGLILECSDKTARKRYRKYLEKAGKESWQQLTLEDVSIIEKRRINEIRSLLF